jgi:hypothetical protein
MTFIRTSESPLNIALEAPLLGTPRGMKADGFSVFPDVLSLWISIYSYKICKNKEKNDAPYPIMIHIAYMIRSTRME